MTEENNSAEGKAKGGIARAKSLTKEQRSEIAIKGAAARWGGDGGVEIAKKSDDIIIGDVIMQCAVLADGTRVLS